MLRSASAPLRIAVIVSRFMLALSMAFTCVSSVMRVPAMRSSSFSYAFFWRSAAEAAEG